MKLRLVAILVIKNMVKPNKIAMISSDSVMTRMKYGNFIIVQHETRMTYDIIHNVNENIDSRKQRVNITVAMFH